MFFRTKPSIPPIHSAGSTVGQRPASYRVHTLADNHNMTVGQHARCVDLVRRAQALYDGTEAYRVQHGIDPALAYAGNEWADIVARKGLVFRDSYNDINYFRIRAPFAGYHLPILDRLDVRRYPDDWGEALVKEVGDGIPGDIVERLARLYAPQDRLLPLVPEYLDHIRNVPPRYIVRPPRMFGEIGIDVRGTLVNADVILCQSRINAMLSGGVLDKLDRDMARNGRARVVEIGAGYGNLGYALRRILGDRLEYIVIDLPSSLYHSAIYLAVANEWKRCHLLMPGERVPEHFEFMFVANYMVDELAVEIGPVDLGINCMSFPEMSAAQVRHYANFLRQVLRDDGLVFDENAANRPHHTDSKAILAEVFPFRRRVSSEVVTTKNDCQDVWASRYIGEIFDCSDALYLQAPVITPASAV